MKQRIYATALACYIAAWICGGAATNHQQNTQRTNAAPDGFDQTMSLKVNDKTYLLEWNNKTTLKYNAGGEPGYQYVQGNNYIILEYEAPYGRARPPMEFEHDPWGLAGCIDGHTFSTGAEVYPPSKAIAYTTEPNSETGNP